MTTKRNSSLSGLVPRLKAAAIALAAVTWATTAQGQATGDTPTPLPGSVTQGPTLSAPAPEPVALSERPFESTSGGISLSYPLGSKAIRQVGKDDLVEFQDTGRNWSLVVSRQSYPEAQTLIAARDGKGTLQPGLMERTASAIEAQVGATTDIPTTLPTSGPASVTPSSGSQGGLAGVKWLRKDLTNLGNYDVGMLAYRYTSNFTRQFAQRAIIQANDQIYYLIALTTPARTEAAIPLTPQGDEATEDLGERMAAETFRKILDSVKLLNRKKIYDDQVDRLMRTRFLLTSWENQQNLLKHLMPEQYFRLMREDAPGHFVDIGWRYVVEEPERKGAQDGIRVGTHISFSETGPGKVSSTNRRTEKEYWMSMTADRHHEDWSGLIVVDDGSEHSATRPWPRLVELGSSDLKTSRVLLVNPRDKKQPEKFYQQGTDEDPHQPWVGRRDAYTLNVTYSGTMGDMAPVSRSLAVFYIPQALDSMLPRLVPPNEVKAYMFYTYISDAREVMLRYIEVKPEVVVQFGGQQIRAIPITDHVGYEGSVTTHYVTRTGQYLGCECKDAKLAIVPTDRESLLRIWPDAKLKAPGEREAAPPVLLTPAARSRIDVAPNPPFDINNPPTDPGDGPARVIPRRGDSIVPQPIVPEQSK